ncbi:DUF983 domain-containing protein [Pontibacter sp. H259]|uniref:DUF983 domain-containing protein n=1 Tax=Pontibacter sp. H259 TaxID=3133421 RepID=UPI0030C3B34D
MPKLTKAEAILDCRCPRCRNGKVFTHPAYNLRKFDNMYEDCPVCGLHYEVEVGLFYGAMYISYGLSVGIVLLVGLVLYNLAGDPPTWVYITTVASIILLLTPLLFRYARILMLHFFSGISYDPSYNKA